MMSGGAAGMGRTATGGGGMGKRMRTRGQSTMEYLLVIIAVLVAVIFAVDKIMKPKVDTQFKNASDIVKTAGDKLDVVTGGGS